MFAGEGREVSKDVQMERMSAEVAFASRMYADAVSLCLGVVGTVVDDAAAGAAKSGWVDPRCAVRNCAGVSRGRRVPPSRLPLPPWLGG